MPTVEVLKAAFKPDQEVVKEHLRADTCDERTWEIGAAKKAPVRVARPGRRQAA